MYNRMRQHVAYRNNNSGGVGGGDIYFFFFFFLNKTFLVSLNATILQSDKVMLKLKFCLPVFVCHSSGAIYMYWLFFFRAPTLL